MSITVLGSFNMDLTSRSNGLPRAGESLLGTAFLMGPGGKGSNQAVAAHRAGGKVAFMACLGKDMFADGALEFYTSEGMDTGHMMYSDAPTGTAVIMVDEITGQNQIVACGGANQAMTEADVDSRRETVESGNVFLCQMETNLPALYHAIRIAHEAGNTIILNPAPAAAIDPGIYPLLDYITPNETEAETLTGIPVTDEKSAERAANALRERGVKHVVITLGKQGAYALDEKGGRLVKGIRVKAVDTVGAGDAFNGALAVAVDEGRDFDTALRFGNIAGALSVTRKGAAKAMAYRAEIDERMKEEYGL